MQVVCANGIEFFIEIAGDGPPLLFLGGSGWDLRRTRLPLSPPLSEHFTVALYDQRGQGQSAKPPGPYSILDYARDAVGLLDALGWEKAHVIGYSFGGMVAQELAIGWPERINRLILAATTAGGDVGASYPIHLFLDLPPLERAMRGREVADLRFDEVYLAKHPNEADARIRSRASAQNQFIDEPGAQAGLEAQLSARAAHDTASRLDRITAETLVVAGAFDGQAPLAHVRAMAEALPRATFQTVPGPHDFIAEGPEFFAKAITFLSGTPIGSS